MTEDLSQSIRSALFVNKKRPNAHSPTLLTQSRRDCTRKSVHVKFNVRLKQSRGRSAKNDTCR